MCVCVCELTAGVRGISKSASKGGTPTSNPPERHAAHADARPGPTDGTAGSPRDRRAGSGRVRASRSPRASRRRDGGRGVRKCESRAVRRVCGNGDELISDLSFH